MNLLKISTFLIFLSYWGITVFFNFPDTSIVIGENYSKYKIFDKYLYQKWQFFAPPPQSNSRLYFTYIFKNKKNQIEKYEIELFEKYVQKLKKEYLINDLNANIEYLVFNNSNVITDVFSKLYGMYKLKNNCDGDTCFQEFYIKTLAILEHSNTFDFLLNHSERLSNKLNLPPNTFIKITLKEIDIPKYSERHKKNNNKNQKIGFISNYYMLVRNLTTKLS